MLISEAPRNTQQPVKRLPNIGVEPVLPTNPTPLNLLTGMIVTANEAAINGSSDDVLADFALNIGRVRQNAAAHNILTQQSGVIGKNDLVAVDSAVAEGTLPPEEGQAIGDYINKVSTTPELATQSGISVIAPTPEGQKQVEASYKIAQALEENIQKNEGLGNTIYNTMVSLIPFRNNLLNDELTGKMGMGSWEKFVNYYRAQTPEEQSSIADAVLSKMDRIEGYDWEKESFLSDLISNSSDQDIQVKKIFQWLDIGVTTAEVGIVARAAMKARIAAGQASRVNPASVLQATGSNQLAGAVNGAAIASPELAAKFGIDRTGAMFDGIFKTERTENVINTPQINPNSTLSALNGRSHYDPTKVNEFTRQAQDALLNLDYLNPQLFNAEERVAAVDKAARQHIEEVVKTNKYTSTTTPSIEVIDTGDPTKLSIKLGYTAEKEVDVYHPLNAKLKEAEDLLTASPKMNTKRLAAKLNVSVDEAATLRQDLKKGRKDTEYQSPIKNPTKQTKTMDLEETITLDLTKNAWGTMDEMHNGDHVFGGLGTSPKMQFRSAADNSTTVNRMVEDTGLVIAAREQFGNTVGRLFTESTKGIGIRGRKRLNNALADSDATNTIHDPTKLATQFGMKNKEIDAYYKVNKLLDIAKDIEDFKAYRTAKLQGVKQSAAGNTVVRGRVFDDAGGGFTETLRAMGYSAPDSILDVASDKVIKLADLASHLKANGGKLMIADNVHPTPHGNFSAMILPETSIEDITFDTYRSMGRQGYVPTIRPSAKYFVDEEYETVINGKTVTQTRTVGAGTSRAEQAALIAERKQDIADGKIKGITDPNKVSGRYDREGVAPSSDLSNVGNRTFTGHRSSRELIWKGVADRRLPPLQAIAKNMEYLSNSYPINEWKMAMIERWKNSVRASRTPQAADNELSLHTPIDTGTAQGRVLEAQRKYLASTLGIPSESQLHWEGLTVRLSEFIEGKGNNKLMNAMGRGLREASTKDIISTIKYHTFHSLLGWFNPAQLIVQASNIANIASIHPWLTTSNFHKMMALRAMVHIKNEKAIKFIGDKSGFGEELVDTVKQFRRMGGDQLQLNADFNAALQGMGVTRAAFHKAATTGLLPYYHGELSARTVAYVAARAKVMRDLGVSDWKKLNDDHHRLINDHFKNLSLNLGRENQAGFQRGIAGAATQFMHVQTKYLETFFGSKFTPAEKIRMVLGNIALFGSAGIPFGTYLAEKYAGLQRDENNAYDGAVPEEVIRQGLLSFIAGDTDLAGRLAIPNGISDQIMKVLDDTGDPLWSTLMGASGTLLQRGSYAANMTAAFMFAPDAVTEKSFWDVLRSWGSITSTFNNAEQAYFMWQADKFINKNTGKILFNSPTNEEIFSKALGFSSVREKESYEMALDVKKREQYVKKNVDAFFKQIINNGDDPYSVEYSEKFRDNLQVWANLAGGGEEFDVVAIQKGIWDRLANPQSKEEAALADILRNASSEQIDARNVGKAIQYRYGE